MRAPLLPLLLICAAVLIPALAQEGHPVTGTWHGSWGPTPEKQTDATFIMGWDGKEITGIINPGFDTIQLRKATLEAASWTIHMEAEGKDASGKAVAIVIDGKFEDVTSPRRSIVGTWTQGGVKAPFKITRDN
jgi:hypothetical protein